MELKHKGNLLELVFGEDTVTYHGRSWPSGAIAGMVMNITDEALTEMDPLCDRFAQLDVMLRTNSADKAALQSARNAAHTLIPLIAQWEPFTYLSESVYIDCIDPIFSLDAYKKMKAYYSALTNGKMNEENKKKYDPTIGLVLLTPALAYFSKGVRTLKDHIGPFADRLAEDDRPRSREDYLAMFRTVFSENISLGDGSDSWMAATNTTVQYAAMLSPETGKLELARHMHFTSFSGMFRADFFEGLNAGHAPRRCDICGRWFLTTNARHTRYCSGICPDDPKGLTCRAIGNRKGREFREKAIDHPLNEIYRRCVNTIDQQIHRGKLDKELGCLMKLTAKDKLDRAKCKPAYAQKIYENEMNVDFLREEASRRR